MSWIWLYLFLFGCLGGLTNATISGELKLPVVDRKAGVYRPGWIGNTLIGGVAALVLLLPGLAEAAALKGPQVVSAVLSGMGGGRLLTNEGQRFALTQTKRRLSQTVRNMATHSAKPKP